MAVLICDIPTTRGWNFGSGYHEMIHVGVIAVRAAGIRKLRPHIVQLPTAHDDIRIRFIRPVITGVSPKYYRLITGVVPDGA